MQNNLTMPSKLNSTIGGAILTRKKPIEDKDDPPPPISQNHYRHIHEQRDFTMENLSMSGETELADYEAEHMGIGLEDVNELEKEI